MNTGHDGCAATLHANGVEDVVARVEALAAPAGLPRAALHAQLASAVQAVVHLVRAKGKRRLASIGVIDRGFGETQVLTAVEFDAEGTATYGAGADRLSRLLDLDVRETPDKPAPDSENQDPDAGLDHLDSWQEALAAADRLLPTLKNVPGGDEADPEEPFVADYGPSPTRRGGHR
jgi:pilus assembly protein CpaF